MSDKFLKEMQDLETFSLEQLKKKREAKAKMRDQYLKSEKIKKLDEAKQKKLQEAKEIIKKIDQLIEKLQPAEKKAIERSDLTEDVFDLLKKKECLGLALKVLSENNLPTIAIEQLLKDTDNSLQNHNVNGIPANRVELPEELKIKVENSVNQTSSKEGQIHDVPQQQPQASAIINPAFNQEPIQFKSNTCDHDMASNDLQGVPPQQNLQKVNLKFPKFPPFDILSDNTPKCHSPALIYTEAVNGFNALAQ